MCFLSAFSPIWLKTQLVAKQRSVCLGHPVAVGAHSPCTWAVLMQIRGFATTHTKTLFSPSVVVCKPVLSKAPCCFCNWPIVKSLNTSDPHTIILLKAPPASPATCAVCVCCLVCCLCTISWATLSYFRERLLTCLRRHYQTLPLTQGSNGDQLMTRLNKLGLVQQDTFPLEGSPKRPEEQEDVYQQPSANMGALKGCGCTIYPHFFPLVLPRLILDYLLHCSAFHAIGSSTRKVLVWLSFLISLITWFSGPPGSQLSLRKPPWMLSFL